MKRTLSLILSAVMLLSVVSGLNLTAFAGGTDIFSAVEIPADGTVIEDEVTKEHEQNYYKVPVGKDGKMSFTIAAYCDVFVSIYDENSEYVHGYSIYGNETTSYMESGTCSGLENVCYIRVNKRDSYGMYRLSVKTNPDGTYVKPSAGFKEYKPTTDGNDIFSSKEIPYDGTVIEDEVTKEHEQNYYKVPVGKDGKMSFTIAAYCDVFVSLYDENSKYVHGYSIYGNETTSYMESDTCSGLENVCYIQVNKRDSYGMYRLSVKTSAGVTPVEPSTDYTTPDTNKDGTDIFSAKTIPTDGTVIEDEVTKEHEQNYYKVPVGKNGKMSFTIAAYCDVFVSIYDENSEYVHGYSIYGNETTSYMESDTCSGLENVCYIQVNKRDSYGKYRLSVNVTYPSSAGSNTTAKPSGNAQKNTITIYNIKNVTIVNVKKVKVSKKSVTFKWKAVKGASGYQIKYSTKKSFKKAKTCYSKKSRKTIKKLKRHKKYYIRVRSYIIKDGKKYYSKWSKVKAVKTK